MIITKGENILLSLKSNKTNLSGSPKSYVQVRTKLNSFQVNSKFNSVKQILYLYDLYFCNVVRNSFEDI